MGYKVKNSEGMGKFSYNWVLSSFSSFVGLRNILLVVSEVFCPLYDVK